MENRVFIGGIDETKLFFEQAKRYGDFKTWKALWTFLEVGRGSFWNMYIGKTSIPKNIFLKLCKFLPKEHQKRYNHVAVVKDGNWGRKKGGRTTYSKHPEIFELGRKMPRKSNNMLGQRRFNFDQPLSSDLCEFLGAFAGDGFTNKYGRHFHTGFSGDNRYDMDYYNTKILPIAKRLFNINSAYVRKKGNGMWVNFHSKDLFELLTKRFGMPAGVKFDKVTIPTEIMKDRIEYKTAFVRGILDTDGCVFFDNRKTYKTPYFRIDITMFNIPILVQINQILTELGVHSKVLGNGKHLQVTSKKDVEKFLRIIGSSNERHISKIEKKCPNFRQWNPAFNPPS
ncbi:MAG: LAGLIDADG family homing endonuclease [Candidatus Diapherotrites archaeon]|nr:LAGLIDADG family homing endonuclease [Candidatus Diapherotrites archaeon]